MSRNIASIGIAVAVAVAFLFVGAGAVAAHGSNDVGTSGHCSDENGNGGGGEVNAGSGGVDATDPGEVESVIAGLQEFYQEKQDHPDRSDTCDGGADGTSYDYLEAHAGPVQFCYSEQNSNNQGDVSANGGDACGSH